MLELRTRTGQLPPPTTEERDPEISVCDESAIGAVAGLFDDALKLGDVPVRTGEAPADLALSDRGTKTKVDRRVAACDQRECAIEERERFTVGEPLEGVLAGDDEVLRRPHIIPCQLEMHCYHRGKLALALGIEQKQRVRGEAVQRAAILLQERAVRRVLHEGVPEEVLELRLDRGNLDEPARLQGPELGASVHTDLASRMRSSSETAN